MLLSSFRNMLWRCRTLIEQKKTWLRLIFSQHFQLLSTRQYYNNTKCSSLLGLSHACKRQVPAFSLSGKIWSHLWSSIHIFGQKLYMDSNRKIAHLKHFKLIVEIFFHLPRIFKQQAFLHNAANAVFSRWSFHVFFSINFCRPLTCLSTIKSLVFRTVFTVLSISQERTCR